MRLQHSRRTISIVDFKVILCQLAANLGGLCYCAISGDRGGNFQAAHELWMRSAMHFAFPGRESTASTSKQRDEESME